MTLALPMPDDKLYLIEPFVGVIRMDLDVLNTQSVYAPFSLTAPSLPNDLTFDGDGNLYFTDSFQATISRVPAGAGIPTVWFVDPRLASAEPILVGVNGVRIDKNKKNVYVSVTFQKVRDRPCLSDKARIYKLMSAGFGRDMNSALVPIAPAVFYAFPQRSIPSEITENQP